MLTPSELREGAEVTIVVMGASVGAIDVLLAILPRLPSTARVPVVVVVHVPPHAPSILVDVFAERCALPVREARDKEPSTPGIWFAPPDYHLLVEADRSLSLSADDPVHFSRPSIDVLFESAAAAFGATAAGVVLTGSSRDGADGAKAIRDAGGLVIVQDPQSAESSVMPAAAIERSRPQRIATPPAIAELLRRLVDPFEAREEQGRR